MRRLPSVRVGMGFSLWGASGNSSGANAPGSSQFGPGPTTFNPGTVVCPPGSTIEPNNTCTDNVTNAVVAPIGVVGPNGTVVAAPPPAPTGVPSNGGLYGGGSSAPTTNPYIPNTNLPGRGSPSSGGGVTAVGPAPIVQPVTVPNPVPGLPPIVVNVPATPPAQTGAYANPASQAAAVRGVATSAAFPVVPVAIGVAALGAIALLLAGARP
jgi:hypothetical protein